MSSPFLSLQKHKKLPFSTYVPFRKVLPTINSVLNAHVLEEGHDKSVPVEFPDIYVEIDKCSPRNCPSSDVPSDYQLMTLMTSKIKDLERKVSTQTKEIVKKNEAIKKLEEAIEISKLTQNSEKCNVLEEKCIKLEQQIAEMEEFLTDYGLIWVGNADDAIVSTIKSPLLSSKIVWHPEESRDPEVFNFSYDLLVKNICDLNILSCQGVSHIHKTSNGARLKQQESIKLTIYLNGIFLFNGPFRSFADASTRQFIIDILDGYFPSELQQRFPDGVPFDFTDKRDVNFEKTPTHVFSGDGNKLVDGSKDGCKDSGNDDASKIIIDKTKKVQKTEFQNGSLTLDQFINKLPNSYIKNGQIMDVKEQVKNTLQGNTKEPSIQPITIERPFSSVSPRPRSQQVTHPMTRLRIRSETGNETYLLTMRFSDTIGHVRLLLDKQRGRMAMADYEIVSAFPSTRIPDESATLESLGLIPTASLNLRPIHST